MGEGWGSADPSRWRVLTVYALLALVGFYLLWMGVGHRSPKLAAMVQPRVVSGTVTISLDPTGTKLVITPVTPTPAPAMQRDALGKPCKFPCRPPWKPGMIGAQQYH